MKTKTLFTNLQCVNINSSLGATFLFIAALISQLFFIIIQYCFQYVIPEHIPDGVFHTIESVIQPKLQNDLIENILGSLVRWDASYFLHISQYGYTYENTTAFFPLFPIIVNIIALPLQSLSLSFLSISSCYLLSAVVTNSILFSLTTIVLYKLALSTSNNNYNFSSIVVILFLVNPARVFFIAPYSESTFSFFSFSGMLFLYCKTDLFNFKSIICFSLAAATRSNGLLNIGFIIHKCVCDIYLSCVYKRKSMRLKLMIPHLASLIGSVIIVCMPFVYYQYKVRTIFCTDLFNITNPNVLTHAYENNYILPGKSRASYCTNTFEFPYGYVQSHYWNVGFLKYFQFKQIPNFLLAMPILLLILYNSYYYFIRSNRIMLLINFKIFQYNYYSTQQTDLILFSYYLHVTFLAVFCCFCIHVQVSTRMLLSSSPAVYFIVAKFVMDNHKLKKYCLIYFCSYCFVGVLLFTNYYPWT